MEGLSVSTFNPKIIPFQHNVLRYVRKEHDYSVGKAEILLSGAVGSAKSVLMAHIGVTHCIFNNRARLLLGRRALQDLRDTLYSKIRDQLDDENLVEGKDYWAYDRTCNVRFRNGSEIIARTWADKKVKKMRSLDLSGALLEELTENEDFEYYKEISNRIGRIKHIDEKFIIGATNPDSPAHPVHKYFIESENPRIKVFYSITEDNPFLDKSYIQSLKETMTPKEAKRMLYGEWIELSKEVVYYNYETTRNFVNQKYEWNLNYPICLMHDFNIGFGKPMSAAVGQVINGFFHVAKSYLVEGARTENIMDEMANDGLFELKVPDFIVFGDASGKHRDTRNIKSDYDIIKTFLANYKTKDGRQLKFEIRVPISNPPIRERENLVNALFLNAADQVKMFVYKDAKDVDTGFRMTKYKKGATLTEDDSLREQHVTTAVGYWVWYTIKRSTIAPIKIS